MHIINRTDAPTFDAGGTAVTAYAAPSRGAAEVSLWRLELAPGSTSPLHHMDREEVFLGLARPRGRRGRRNRARARRRRLPHPARRHRLHLARPRGRARSAPWPACPPGRGPPWPPTGHVRATVGRVTEPDLAILITAANRCVADRLGAGGRHRGRRGRCGRRSASCCAPSPPSNPPSRAWPSCSASPSRPPAGSPTTWSRSATSSAPTIPPTAAGPCCA